MNALLIPPPVTADALLALLVQTPGLTCSQLAERLQRPVCTISQLLAKLRLAGLLLPGRGCTTPSLQGRDRVRRMYHPTEPTPAMETTVSINPSTQAIIDALERQQDPLLRAANRRLQARVLELEAEVVRLSRRRFR